MIEHHNYIPVDLKDAIAAHGLDVSFRTLGPQKAGATSEASSACACAALSAHQRMQLNGLQTGADMRECCEGTLLQVLCGGWFLKAYNLQPLNRLICSLANMPNSPPNPLTYFPSFARRRTRRRRSRRTRRRSRRSPSGDWDSTRWSRSLEAAKPANPKRRTRSGGCSRDLDRRKAGQSWPSDPSQNQRSLFGDPLCGLQKSQPKQPEKGLKRCVKTGSAACSFRNQRHSHRPLPDIAPFKYRGCPFDLGPLIRGISISFFQGTPKKCSTNKKNDSTCRKTRLRRETWRRAHGFLAPPARGAHAQSLRAEAVSAEQRTL